MFKSRSPGSIISAGRESLYRTNDESPSENPKHKIEWSYVNEEILAEWCDIAQCYRWMNYQAHMHYSRLNTWFVLPVISLSTLNGTASFMQVGVTNNTAASIPMIVGTISICIGIISTIHQYLKISELKEAFKISTISWDKYARNIYIELSKPPADRIDAGTFIKLSRQEYDRMLENNPMIPQHIIDKFKRAFKGKTAEEKEHFSKIKKPDICDVIVSINEKRHMWFQEDAAADIHKPFHYSIPSNNDQESYYGDNRFGQRSEEASISEANLYRHNRIIENNLESQTAHNQPAPEDTTRMLANAVLWNDLRNSTTFLQKSNSLSKLSEDNPLPKMSPTSLMRKVLSMYKDASPAPPSPTIPPTLNIPKFEDVAEYKESKPITTFAAPKREEENQRPVRDIPSSIPSTPLDGSPVNRSILKRPGSLPVRKHVTHYETRPKPKDTIAPPQPPPPTEKKDDCASDISF
jgi:hypothetical protein